MSILIADKHFCITSAPEVQLLINPLKHIGICFFNHVRIYHSKPQTEITLLCNHPSWTQYFNKRQLKGSLSLHDLPTGIYPWQEVINPQIVAEARKHFNLDNLVNFLYPSKNYIDLFAFGTATSNKASFSVYFNNIHLLQNFIEYFKAQSISLFNKADRERIIMPPKVEKRTNFALCAKELQQQRKLLLSAIGAIQQQYKLTNKEINCLKYLTLGNSTKEIATLLNNSPRTISSHLEKIKHKTGCYSKSQLIELYYVHAPVPHYMISPKLQKK